MFRKKKKKNSSIVLNQIEEKNNSLNDRKTMIDHEFLTILLEIQEKLNSPVFNGGFESLVQSVEDIKHKTEEHITAINKTIYGPDEGLFSRIKSAEKKQEDNDNVIKHELSDIKNRIGILENSKAGLNKIVWAAGLGLIGLLFKTVWDLFSNHIIFK